MRQGDQGAAAPAPSQSTSHKWLLVEQLKDQIRAAASNARREAEAAAEEAREGASPAEKRLDARVAIEYASLARGQAQREARAREALATLASFRPGRLGPRGPIGLGAIVEVEDEGEGRTFFLAPVGAGVELTMPGGDGFLTVVTPASPFGRAVLGKRLGDEVEVVVEGEPRHWLVTFVD
jgi:transcription elongation GreA/GreB family factor